MEAATRAQQILEESGALQKGHFLLSSGKHSQYYCQCAALFRDPRMGERMAQLLAGDLPEELSVDVVLAPALGGVLWGYELARQLGRRSIFAERQPGGPFELRRGFALERGERVLLAEDVITTGRSVLELRPIVRAAGAEVVCFASVVDRSRGEFAPPEPFYHLANLDFPLFEANDCPLCEAGEPLVKPGSRQPA